MLLSLVHIGHFATFAETRFAALDDAFDSLGFLFIGFLRDSGLMSLDFLKSSKGEVTQFWRLPHSLLLHAGDSAAPILDLDKLSSQGVDDYANVSGLGSCRNCHSLDRKQLIASVRVCVAACARVFFLRSVHCSLSILYHVSLSIVVKTTIELERYLFLDSFM